MLGREVGRWLTRKHTRPNQNHTHTAGRLTVREVPGSHHLHLDQVRTYMNSLHPQSSSSSHPTQPPYPRTHTYAGYMYGGWGHRAHHCLPPRGRRRHRAAATAGGRHQHREALGREKMGRTAGQSIHEIDDEFVMYTNSFFFLVLLSLGFVAM